MTVRRVFTLCAVFAAAPHLAQAGEMDTHMSATYALARHAGLDEKEASLVARANWSMDLNNVTVANPDIATDGHTFPDGNVPSGSRVKRGERYHALGRDGESVRANVVRLREAIAVQARVSREAELRAVGQYLHALQDVYFHQTFAKPDGKLLGHVHEWHASDRVVTHYDAAVRAFETTAEVLRAVAANESVPPTPPASELYRRAKDGTMVSKQDLERMRANDAMTGVMSFGAAIALSYGSKRTKITGDPGEPDMQKMNEGLERAWKALGHADELEPLPRMDWKSPEKLHYDQRPDLLSVPLEPRAAAAPTPTPVGGIALSRAAAERLPLALDLDAIHIENGAVVLSGLSRSGASRLDAPLFLTTMRLACEREDASFSLDPANGAAWMAEARIAMKEASTALVPILDGRIAAPDEFSVAEAVDSGESFLHGPEIESASIRSLDPALWENLRRRHPDLRSRLVFRPEWLRGTRVGEILYEADLLLKELSSGVSLRRADERAAVASVPGWISAEEDRLARMAMDQIEGRAVGDPLSARLWFEVPRPAAANPFAIPTLPPSLLTPGGFLGSAERRGSAGVDEVRARLRAKGYLASITSTTRSPSLSADRGALDLSDVWPNVFVRVHDVSTGEDMPGTEAALDALADRVNSDVAGYAERSAVLGRLVAVLRAYVASVQVTRKQPALCEALAALPFSSGERLREPLPEEVAGDLLLTVLRLDVYTAAGRQATLAESVTLQGGVSMAGRNTTVVQSATAITRAVADESAHWRTQPPQWSAGERAFVAFPLDLAEAAAELAALPERPAVTLEDVEAILSGKTPPSRAASARVGPSFTVRLLSTRWTSAWVSLAVLAGMWGVAARLVIGRSRAKKESRK